MIFLKPELPNPIRYLLSLALFILAGCANIEEPSGKSEESEVADQVIWNGIIEVTENGHLQSLVQAGYIELFERNQITLFDSGVVVDFYNKLGQHTSVLTSQRARVEEKLDLFVALGNVVVVSDSGEILRTERLYWDKSNNRIRSDTLAILTTAYDSLRGYNFESDENLKSWTLEKPTGHTFRKKDK